MKHTHHSRRRSRASSIQHWMRLFIPHSTLSAVTLGLSCVVASFLIGVQTAGEVQTFEAIEAEDAVPIAITGDVNGDGDLSIEDALLVLEVVQGYRTPTREQLLRDPNGDGQLTVDDAQHILRTISLR